MCSRGIQARLGSILVTFGSILTSICIAIRLYSGCPKSIRVKSWRFCLIRDLFGTYSSLTQGAPRIRDEQVPNQPNPSDSGHIRAELVRIYSGEFGSGITLV